MSQDCPLTPQEIVSKKLERLNEKYLKLGLYRRQLRYVGDQKSWQFIRKLNIHEIILYSSLLVCILTHPVLIDYYLGVRCLVPNNYFIWEATRPIADCSFCSNVSRPIVLPNLTREQFEPYAYSSKPIVIRGAATNWPAMETFTFNYFKELYANALQEDSNSNCQFLHLKSDFTTLKDVFAMSKARVKNRPGETSWYVGWDNCDPNILVEIRRHYPKPHFLPEDAELSMTDYIFMGYDDGASMHLDFINRLMWQAQLQGSKIWHLVPPPECQSVCHSFKFLVQPGDAVLVDTDVWYHATSIPDGQFSLSVQSQYG